MSWWAVVILGMLASALAIRLHGRHREFRRVFRGYQELIEIVTRYQNEKIERALERALPPAEPQPENLMVVEAVSRMEASQEYASALEGALLRICGATMWEPHGIRDRASRNTARVRRVEKYAKDAVTKARDARDRREKIGRSVR